MAALRGWLAVLHVGLNKSPNKIGRRGAFSAGKRFQFAQDSFWKFNSGLHTVIVS